MAGSARDNLRRSPYLETSPDGRATFCSRRLPLADWRSATQQLAALMRFAARHGLWLRSGPPDRAV
jgi:hypothetical protein